MKKSIFLFYIIGLLFSSCKNNAQSTVSDDEMDRIINTAVYQFFETNDRKYLEEAYDTLQSNQTFRKDGLTKKNSLAIISLLMNLKKFEELEKLLTINRSIDAYNRKTTLNITKFYNSYGKDKERALSYIKENIKLITDSIKQSPKDSLLYGDYFSMRMFIGGKEAALREIDSMQSSNKNHSDVFYKMLKESVEMYPEGLLPKQ